MRICAGALLLLSAAMVVVAPAVADDARWLNHLLPLPKQVRIEGTMTVPTAAVAVRTSVNASDVELQAAREIGAALTAPHPTLPTGGEGTSTASTAATTAATTPAAAAARPGKAKAQFEIVLGVCDAKGRLAGKVIPEAATLAKKPNSDQAYCVVPAGRSKLIVTALAPQGLYYGAVTLGQLLEAGRGTSPRPTVTVPLVRVVDWPDLSERGVWGSYAIPDVEWMAGQKLNLIETHANFTVDRDGKAVASFSPELVTRGRLRALKVVPIIHHLDQLEGTGMFAPYPDLKGVGPKTKLADTLQTVCYSKPMAVKILCDWATDIARNPEITDLCIWLSEDPGYCECEQCKGQNQFVLETKACVAAGRAAQTVNPKLKLRILLTQGTYADNDKVLAAIPPDVNVSYYDGGRTYDSSRDPMIYPLLEAYAKQGRWLGVYPQITASWRIVCPFSSPQFMKSRMTEFVDKKLACLCGYATPSMRLWDFNSAAAAEWGWNAHGRDERQFALAWATTRKLADPQKAADWAMALGNVSWDVYGSRIPFTAFFGEAGSMIKNRAKPVLGKGMYRYFPTEEKLRQSLAACAKAGQLAAALKSPEITAETQVVTGYLQMIELLYRMSNLITRPTPPTDAERLGLQQELLDFALTSEGVKAGLRTWAEACLPGTGVGGRLADTLEVNDTTVATVSDALLPFGVRNPVQPYLRKRIGGWQDDDFEAKQRITKTFEVTSAIQGPGEYRVDLTHEKGWNGLNGYSVALATGDDPTKLTQVVVDKHTSTIGYTPVEPVYVLKLATYDPQAKYFIVADISGVKSSDKVPERRGCQGNVSLWKVQQPGEKIEALPLLPMSDTEKARYGGPQFGKSGLRVGVMQGGYGSESLLKALQGTVGVDAQPLWLISDKNLTNCQVLVATQPRAGSAINDDAAKTVARFVEKGGGVFATHDAVGYRSCPVLLPAVGKGARHVRVEGWTTQGNHPVNFGFAAGAACRESYYDAVALEPAAGARVLGVAGAEKLPVLVAGEVGKGRAVLCGLGMAFGPANDADVPPTPDEVRLLANTVRWCAHEAPPGSALLRPGQQPQRRPVIFSYNHPWGSDKNPNEGWTDPWFMDFAKVRLSTANMVDHVDTQQYAPWRTPERRLLARVPVRAEPWKDDKVNDLLKAWEAALSQPGIDGFAMDEFCGSEVTPELMQVWIAAIKEIRRRHPDMLLAYWSDSGFGRISMFGQAQRPLLEALRDNADFIMPEIYYSEKAAPNFKTEPNPFKVFREKVDEWELQAPGITAKILMGLGTVQGVDWGYDNLAEVDYGEFLAKQIEVCATDPVLKQMGGLALYAPGYLRPEVLGQVNAAIVRCYGL